MSIRIQIIPTKCTGRNLHSGGIIQPEKWKEISLKVRKAQNFCKYCGGVFSLPELNAHEVWSFNEEKQVQVLEEIVGVCTKCHSTVHFNFIMSNKNLVDRDFIIAEAHYLEANGCDVETFQRELDNALSRRSILNQMPGSWAMDISYAIKAGLLSWEDINIENLEKVAPGSKKYLEPYKDVEKETKKMLLFNKIPEESLIDHADCYCRRMFPTPCEICGKKELILYHFYDLRVKNDASELFLSGTEEICADCRETIYHGANKLFPRFRKTTKHYMQVNNCSYKEFKEHVSRAKEYYDKNQNLYVYLNIHKEGIIPHEEYLRRKQYVEARGAIFEDVRKQWRLAPARNLKDVLDYL